MKVHYDVFVKPVTEYELEECRALMSSTDEEIRMTLCGIKIIVPMDERSKQVTSEFIKEITNALESKWYEVDGIEWGKEVLLNLRESMSEFYEDDSDIYGLENEEIIPTIDPILKNYGIKRCLIIFGMSASIW